MADILTYDDLPPDVQATLDVAFRALDLRRYREAIPGLTAAVQAFPNYIHGVFALAMALRASGERDQASAHFVAAAAIAPDDPMVCLGLAWKALDDDDFDAAGALATRALPGAELHLRGDILAVLGVSAEATGRIEVAARLYLEAYEAGTKLHWLAAHCRLAGIPYLIESHGSDVPWPATAAQRRWMYAAIEVALVEAGRAKVPDVPDNRVLLVGCDNTTRQTTAWAARAGVERAQLYQALACRGGFCDCEVLLNAANQDGHDGFALIAGFIDGPPDEIITGLGDLLNEALPSDPAHLDPEAEPPVQILGIYVDAAHARIPLQVTDSETVGRIVCAMADHPPAHARLHLLIGFIGEPPAFIVVGPDRSPLRARELAAGPVPGDLEQSWPGLITQLEQLRAGLPTAVS